eukprot:1781251-Rhodomonas_salina.1
MLPAAPSATDLSTRLGAQPLSAPRTWIHGHAPSRGVGHLARSFGLPAPPRGPGAAAAPAATATGTAAAAAGPGGSS